MKETKYSRDKRSPPAKSKTVSRIMSANKRKDTKPELLFRHELWKNSIKGYRLHWNKIPGRPDLVFVNKKIAIFINGCYWHRCPHCNLPIPKTNTSFWINKFNANVKRDQKKIDDLKALGWQPLVIWECELEQNPIKWVAFIKELLNNKKKIN